MNDEQLNREAEKALFERAEPRERGYGSMKFTHKPMATDADRKRWSEERNADVYDMHQ